MKSRHTLPERLVASELVRRGQDFEQHCSDLPGTPDFVFRSGRLALFVNGCYWHRHFGCPRVSIPKKESARWLRTFGSIVQNDQTVIHSLRTSGWRVYVVWECEVLEDPADACAGVLRVLERRATEKLSLAG